jgi:hypothetical protein
MTESEEDRQIRRARAMFAARAAGRSWEAAEEGERRHWLEAAHAVEASDAAAGIRPMPLDRPFGGGRRGDSRGLGAHMPAIAAMYEQAGIDPAPPRQTSGDADGPGGPLGPPLDEKLEPGRVGSMLPAIVPAMLAVAVFIAFAALLLAFGYYLAAGG